MKSEPFRNSTLMTSKGDNNIKSKFKGDNNIKSKFKEPDQLIGLKKS